MNWTELHPASLQLQMGAIDNEYNLSIERLRPCNIKSVRVNKYGDGWMCFLGEGYPSVDVNGIGKTPEEACKAFDDAWNGVEK